MPHLSVFCGIPCQTKPEKELHPSLLDATDLLVIVLVLVVDNVVELELVDTGRGGDDAEPVTELLLLEELLGPNHQILSAYTSSIDPLSKTPPSASRLGTVVSRRTGT